VLAAELELATTAAIAGEGLRYTVINIGALPIMLGEAYELKRLTDDGWERVKVSARYPLRKRLAVDRDPHPGYEWVACQEIEPLEVTAEFEVTKD
jgi:hypothetical protein